MVVGASDAMNVLRRFLWFLAKCDFPKIRAPYFGVLVIRIRLFRVLY